MGVVLFTGGFGTASINSAIFSNVDFFLKSLCKWKVGSFFEPTCTNAQWAFKSSQENKKRYRMGLYFLPGVSEQPLLIPQFFSNVDFF